MKTLSDNNRPTQTRIQVCIPKRYHQKPVVSHLVSDYGLTVNILAALLGANAQNDGWFDLELRGTSDQIHAALAYLHNLDHLEVLDELNSQADGW